MLWVHLMRSSDVAEPVVHWFKFLGYNRPGQGPSLPPIMKLNGVILVIHSAQLNELMIGSKVGEVYVCCLDCQEERQVINLRIK